MLKRIIAPKLIEWAKQYPIVTMTGPRQSGKTTLVKEVFPHKPYVNLEDLQERNFAIEDPKGFLNRFPQGAVLDEIQNVPQLLSQIQVVSDARNTSGLFILIGSNQLTLKSGISQSLAGRTALAQLLPFQIKELRQSTTSGSYAAQDYLYSGFYPRIWDKKLNPTEALSFYVQTYIEKDINNLMRIKDLARFQTFLQLCAGRVGQLLNYTSLARDTGISENTARDWISLLENSYLVFRLKPYHSNIKKRLIKSPKLYFWDVGIASYLIGIQNSQQLITHPLKGQLFENMIIADLMKNIIHAGKQPRVYFYRDSNGIEADLVMGQGQETELWEIKSGQTYTTDSTRNLASIRSTINLDGKNIVVYGGEGRWEQNGTQVFGWREKLNGIE
jgi:predicted AAA+ superfamily ATPase